jgi:hypothetical protein
VIRNMIGLIQDVKGSASGSKGIWQKYLICLLFVSSMLLMPACSPVTRAEQVTSTQMTALERRQVIGQTLVANYAGLTAVDVYLDAGDEAGSGGELRLQLKSSPQNPDVLADAVLPLAQVTNPGFYRLSFPPIPNSSLQPFYFSLELADAERIQLALAPGRVYPDGSFYIDHQPVEGQMTFQLAYDPVQMVVGLSGEFLSWTGVLLAAGFLYIVPGWALLAALWKGWHAFRWPEKLGLAVGPGLAIYPLLFLWSGVAGIKLGALLAWAPAVLGAVYLARRSRGFRFQRPLAVNFAKPSAPDLILLVVLGLVVFGRFFSIRELPAPLWGDSLQHAVMAQLMVDQGGLFHSWQPYAAYQSLTVQFGFSSAAAVWIWLTGDDIMQATLWFGQVLNILAIVSLYPMTMLVSNRSRWAGVGAVVVGGLLNIMPAFYLNWGRYAQLFGQAILPAAAALTWHYLRGQHLNPKAWIVIALVISGMALGYYRMAFFYAAFIPGLLILMALHLRKSQKAAAVPPGEPARGKNWHGSSRFWHPVVGLAAVAVLSLVLISPWIPNITGSSLAETVELGFTRVTPAETVWNDYLLWLNVAELVPLYLVFLSAAALSASLVLRKWEPLMVGLWVLLLSAIRLGMLVRLPGANMLGGNFTIMIALYIPIGVLLGWLAAEVAEWAEKRFPLPAKVVVSAVLVLAGLWGFYQQRGIGNEPLYRLVTHADLPAMTWIRANVPENALFMIEGFRIYRGVSAVGSDAGWWIPLLTGRGSTIPPQYALMNEKPEDPAFTQTLLQNLQFFEEHSPDDPQAFQKLCEWGITHIYIGQQQGLASYEKIQLFSPEDLKSMPLVYAQSRVRIYEFPRDGCPP